MSPFQCSPQIRMRRTRRSASLRALVAETNGSSAVRISSTRFSSSKAKKDAEEAVTSMPACERKSIDGLLPGRRERAPTLGIPAIALFPVIDGDGKITSTAPNAPIRTGSYRIP